MDVEEAETPKAADTPKAAEGDAAADAADRNANGGAPSRDDDGKEEKVTLAACSFALDHRQRPHVFQMIHNCYCA